MKAEHHEDYSMAVQFEEIVTMAMQLSPLEKIRLVERLAETLQQDLIMPQSIRPSLYGILADLGPSPSAEEIDEIRREVWGNFPREDI